MTLVQGGRGRAGIKASVMIGVKTVCVCASSTHARSGGEEERGERERGAVPKEGMGKLSRELFFFL